MASSYAATIGAIMLAVFLVAGAGASGPPAEADAPAAATTPSAPASSPSLEEACRRTNMHYDLCMATLSADRSAATADAAGLARVAILAVQRNASETATYLSTLYDDENLENKTPQLQQCLEDCAERYEAAVGQLTDATVALDLGAYSESLALVAASQAEVKLCQRGCQVVPGHRNVLTQRNWEVDRLCSIALTISRLIRRPPPAPITSQD